MASARDLLRCTSHETRVTSHDIRRRMPIHRTIMLKSPVNRNPTWQPRLQPQIFGTRSVAANFKYVKILPGENVPIPVQERAPQMFRQRFERAAIFCIVGVYRVVVQPRANEIVFLRIVIPGALESSGRSVIHPQSFYPGMTDVSRIRRAGHARKTSRHRATIARSQKLPLLQSEMRELIQPDEQKFRTLVLINVILVSAIAETRSRTVQPGHHMFCFVVIFVEAA